LVPRQHAFGGLPWGQIKATCVITNTGSEMLEADDFSGPITITSDGRILEASISTPPLRIVPDMTKTPDLHILEIKPVIMLPDDVWVINIFLGTASPLRVTGHLVGGQVVEKQAVHE